MLQLNLRLILIISLLLLSACGGPRLGNHPGAPITNDPYNPEYYLSDELEALRQSGSWGESDSVGQHLPQSVFPVMINNQVRMYLDIFQTKQRRSFAIWLERSGKYLPLIRNELRKNGLPQDLAYLAMIESGYNDRACSSAGAVGLWQFVKNTGRGYDLTIDQYVDERQDPVKATQSAIRYLNDLHQQFGDWHLAVAAYNGGPGKIQRGLKKYRAQTFWDLARHDYLALETKRYVPKLIAAIIIARDPHKYGFTDTQRESPLHYDTIEVGPGFDLTAAGLISGSSRKQLAQLNPELLSDKIPTNRSKYLLKIPAGSSDTAKRNLPRLHTIVTTKYQKHIVTSKDRLADISTRYRVSQATLCKANQIKSHQLFVGQRLRIPVRTIDYSLQPANQAADKNIRRQQRHIHQIKRGETINSIARDYDVPPHLIYAWNKSISNKTIRAGQHIGLYMDQQISSVAPAITADKVIPTLSSPSKKYAYNIKRNRVNAAESYVESPTKQKLPTIIAEQKKKKIDTILFPPPKYHWYLVQQGDSLWAIAQRFNTSPSQIKALNNMSSNSIHPGIRLKLRKV